MPAEPSGRTASGRYVAVRAMGEARLAGRLPGCHTDLMGAMPCPAGEEGEELMASLLLEFSMARARAVNPEAALAHVLA